MSTVIGSLLLLGVVAAVVLYMIRQKKKGKSSVCSGCSSCPGGCAHAGGCEKTE